MTAAGWVTGTHLSRRRCEGGKLELAPREEATALLGFGRRYIYIYIITAKAYDEATPQPTQEGAVDVSCGIDLYPSHGTEPITSFVHHSSRTGRRGGFVGNPATKMFAAERDALKWEAYSGALGIQEREMTVVMSYLDNLGTQAALLAGFAFTWCAWPAVSHADG